MVSSMSSNAILAKARAMYGKRLTESDYTQLMECRTVSEVASYLKGRTRYGEIFGDINENDIHRGQLEPVLRQSIYTDIFALSRYAEDKSLAFVDFMAAELEIELIVRCLTHINMGRPEEFGLKLPLSMDKYTKTNFAKLAAVRSYDDIFDAVVDSKYIAVLKKNRPADGERINIALIEAQLYNQNYGTVISAINSAKKVRDRDELRDLFSALLDFRNVSRIIRLKTYYGMSGDKIRPLLIPYGRLSTRTLGEICDAGDVTEAVELINSTYLGRLMAKLENDDKDQIANTMINIYCKHHLRLSPNPTIVMISYVYLKDIELKNIIYIIEATRYGLSAEEKEKLLIK